MSANTHGTGCSTVEQQRRVVIGKLFVWRQLISARARGAVLADSSSFKAVLHKEDIDVVLLPGLDGDEGWRQWPTMASCKAQGVEVRESSVDAEEVKWKRRTLPCVHA
jgi:hypothetical protein